MIIRFIAVIISIIIILWGVGVNPELLGLAGIIISFAVAFAIQQLLGNFAAGLYIFITHPFYVGDYIHVGGGDSSIEGIVREMTLNYTKIQTKDRIDYIINNQQIMQKEILNYRYIEYKKKETRNFSEFQEFLGSDIEKIILYRYRIKLDFDYSLSMPQIDQILSEMVERYRERLPKSSEYYTLEFDHWVMSYIFVIYVKDPEEIFLLKDQMVKEILQLRERKIIAKKSKEDSK